MTVAKNRSVELQNPILRVCPTLAKIAPRWMLPKQNPTRAIIYKPEPVKIVGSREREAEIKVTSTMPINKKNMQRARIFGSPVPIRRPARDFHFSASPGEDPFNEHYKCSENRR